MSMNHASFRFIKRLRQEIARGENVKAELCRETGLHRPTLEGWLTEGYEPKLDACELVAKFFGESLGEFLGDVAGGHDVTECARRVYRELRSRKP